MTGCEVNHVFDEHGICFECDAEAQEPWCSLTRCYDPCFHCASLDECRGLIVPEGYDEK
jgi:hypothetical protein